MPYYEGARKDVKMKLNDLQKMAIRHVKMENENLLEELRKKIYNDIFKEGVIKEKYIFKVVQEGVLEFTHCFDKSLTGYENLAKVYGEDKLRENIPTMLLEVTKLIFPENNVEVIDQKDENDHFLIRVSK